MTSQWNFRQAILEQKYLGSHKFQQLVSYFLPAIGEFCLTHVTNIHLSPMILSFSPPGKGLIAWCPAPSWWVEIHQER